MNFKEDSDMANKLLAANSNRTNFKMYKHGKQWVFASVTALALATAGSVSVAHADTTAAATNTDPQPQASQVTQNQTSSSSGSENTIVTYPHKDVLDNAVKDAQGTPGLTLNKKDDQEVKNADEAAADYAKQTQDINNAKETVIEGQKEKKNHDTYNDSHGATSVLDQAVKDAQNQNIPGLTITKDDDKVSNFKASNSQGLSDWNTNTTKDYQSQADAIKKAVDTQKQRQADYEKQKAAMSDQLKGQGGQQPTYNKRFEGDQVDYTDSNTWVNLPPKTIPTGNGQGITLYGSSNITDAASAKNYHIIGYDSGNTLQNDHIIQKISWDSANASIISGTGQSGDAFPSAYPIADSGAYNQALTVQSGAKILIPNAVHLADGSTRNLVVQATNSNSEGNPWIVLWNSNGAINAVSWPKTSHTRNALGTSLQYWVQGQENEAFLYSQVVSDIDLGQTDSIWDIGESVAVLGLGGGLHLDSGNNQGERINIKASNMMGMPGTFGKNATWGAALNGFNSSPDGVAAYAVYSNSFAHTVSNDPANAHATGVALADFGNSMNLSIPTAPKSEFHYHYNKASVESPTVPAELAVDYHYNKVNYTPNADKHFVDNGQVTDNKVYADGTTATAKIESKLPNAADFDQGLKSVVIDEDYSNYAQYVASESSQVKITNKDNGQDMTNDFTVADDGQGHMTLTLNDSSKATGQTIVVTPSWKINQDVADQTTFKNVAKLIVNGVESTPSTATITTYKSTPHKDVEMGDNVQGDTPNSIDGQQVVAGTVVTFPLSSNDLPAQREHEVTSVVWTDTLDKNLEYQSFKAYLPDANGKLRDVTNNIQLTHDGPKLVFTWGDYLIVLANKDKATAFKKPIIDLVVKVNGDSVVAKNSFDEHMKFKDNEGHETDLDTVSNEVTVKTPDTPDPKKEDLNEQGQDINGQEVQAGQHITYQFDWDFTKDKGLNASDEDISKGFFWADPIDKNALEIGDLNKAQVLDESGNKVDGITFKAYNSLSEVPEEIQKQIKANGLEHRFEGTPFVSASADNPQEFFEKYVKTGKPLKVQIPTIVKSGFSGSFSNTAYQFEFGKATPTNTVTNFVKPAQPNAPATPPSSAAPVAVNSPATTAAQLPQTGNTDDTALIALAAVGLIASLSLAGLGMRKKEA